MILRKLPYERYTNERWVRHRKGVFTIRRSISRIARLKRFMRMLRQRGAVRREWRE